MIEQAYLYLILVGSTIGLVLLLLWRQAREANRMSLALIRRNESHQFDTLAFLRNMGDLLSQAGLRGLAWRLDWYGMPIEGSEGQLDGDCIERRIRVAEMDLQLRIYQHSRRGEQRYFNETLIETLLLLLRTDLSIKAAASDAAFTQMAKLSLFLQHDMKNIAQFIQLMADQLSSVPEGKEQQVLEHLRKAVPLVHQRADRIVRTLTLGQAHAEGRRSIAIEEKLAQFCRLYRLDHRISGAATVCLPENCLDSAFDNILKNYSDLATRHPGLVPSIGLHVWRDGDMAHVTIGADNTPVVTDIERLFEPFWTNDPAGLGIGLYQAKQLLESCGGSMTAESTKGGQLLFRLALPCNLPAAFDPM